MVEIKVRPADLEADRKNLVGLLLQHLTARSTDRRFQWLYHENPHGSARAWIATHGAGEQIVGSGAILPRLVYVAGVPRLAAVMADFWVHPDFRTLGPALKLQRACVEGAAAAGFAFFDLPQGNMPAVYRRMKLLGAEQLCDLAKPLRTEPYLRKRVSQTWLTAPLALVGDLMLRYIDSRGSRGYEIGAHRGEIGPEFSELSQRAVVGHDICVARSSDYLEWRYQRHYYLTYEIFTARRDSRLVAYAAVTETGDYVDVADLFGESDSAVLSLVHELARVFRMRGRITLRIALHASRRRLDLLAAAGLRVRETKPFVIHAFDAAETADSAWFLSYGDIDY